MILIILCFHTTPTNFPITLDFNIIVFTTIRTRKPFIVQVDVRQVESGIMTDVRCLINRLQLVLTCLIDLWYNFCLQLSFLLFVCLFWSHKSDLIFIPFYCQLRFIDLPVVHRLTGTN